MVIKKGSFSVKGLFPKEDHDDIWQTLEENMLVYLTVVKWQREFRCGRESCRMQNNRIFLKEININYLKDNVRGNAHSIDTSTNSIHSNVGKFQAVKDECQMGSKKLRGDQKTYYLQITKWTCLIKIQKTFQCQLLSFRLMPPFQWVKMKGNGINK